MTGTVQAAREALGIRLRDLRRDARLSGRELAALTGWHFTKVSKIEHGRTMPTEDDLELWCFHCRAQNELPDLIATARSIEKMYSEIKRLMRTGTVRYQKEFLADYAARAVHVTVSAKETKTVNLDVIHIVNAIPSED